jgi:hypothetical protein
MKLEDLNNYPEYPSIEVVERFCNFVLDEAEKFTPEVTLGNLQYLGDKQWHTYKLPSKELQTRIKKWLIQNWTLNSKKYLEGILVVCFNFALDKEFFRQALNLYSGEHKQEFEKMLENSTEDHIDPWWSLKNIK